MANAEVDLNPHQIESALFAFKSPLSKGVILADEVGLGKTIEAGILLAQKWAERKRKLLIILPANLRKQWSQELQEKFYLPSIILEAKTFNQLIKQGKTNPFKQSKIVICSYHFARNKEEYVKRLEWDLVVIDEAHKLRNVYRTDNKIGKAIKNAIADSRKILLTATPLQNTLMELYGLVSIIDEHNRNHQTADNLTVLILVPPAIYSAKPIDNLKFNRQTMPMTVIAIVSTRLFPKQLLQVAQI